MRDDPALWDRLAALFRYPGPDYAGAVRACAAAATAVDPAAAGELTAFLGRVQPLAAEALEERFAAGFDLNPACALEIGWHLYGENYERGAFLVRMRERLAQAGVPESQELPDHLTLLLALLPRLPATESAELARGWLLPALGKIRAGLRGEAALFAPLLDATTRLVERWVEAPTSRPAPPVGEGRKGDGDPGTVRE